MTLTWYGQSCFRIVFEKVKGEEQALVIDPFSASTVGFELPKIKADVVLVTHDHPDSNDISAVEGNPFLINGPGEYDVKGISIQGVSAFHDNKAGKERGLVVLYVIEKNNLRLCHLSNLGQKELTPEQLEILDGVDVLMIPVGGLLVIDAKEAVKIINQIEPSFVVPMHYKISGLETELDILDKFLEEMGVKEIKPLERLKIKGKRKSEQEKEEIEVVILKRAKKA